MTNFENLTINQLINSFNNSQLAKAFSSSVFTENTGNKLPKPIYDLHLQNFLDNHSKAQEATPKTIIVVPPTSNITTDIYNNLLAIQLLNNVIFVETLAEIYRNNPNGWDIGVPQEASDYIISFSNAKLRVITNQLQDIISFNQGIASNIDQSLTSREVHNLLLDKVFGSFGFPPSTMNQLDNILTNIANKFSSLNLQFKTESDTLDFLVVIYYFEPILGIDLALPYMNFSYIRINQKSWKELVRIGKVGVSIERLNFQMSYFSQKGLMNLQKIKTNSEGLNTTISIRLGNKVKAILEEIQPSIIEEGKSDKHL
ncbi:hypothetical protein HUN01_34170 [Nostoc edaphicum CCNP1411]|uniref:Uncharacterized protein n=1 Tax=Nostoc edaphicum CCNP1411 TaxID=1472755 RepID=A0A7D7LFJ5_9NOSO|nr:hypothetical protein [Nostoc edaphicum]QMS92393.1 hypothetical protein HUN01_34170 [Nostoc edaphicum CCNP1411]